MNSITKTLRLRDLIAAEIDMLPVLCRFEIPLGFGDASVEEVCRREGVDVETFMAVAAFICRLPYEDFKISVEHLMKYLRSSHEYFLHHELPTVRQHLVSAVGVDGNRTLPLLILKYYDEFVSEVRHHMEYENDHIFTYVGDLLSGKKPTGKTFPIHREGHRPISTALNALKELFYSHYSARGNHADVVTSALYDLHVCERDILTHCRLEDALFAPAVIELEQKPRKELLNGEGDGLKELTDREKEVLRCIARDMTSKEIADTLFLSPHTVTTHRRNICSKLNVHSTTGLVVYALLNGLITLEEVK